MPLDLDDGYTLPFETKPTLTDPATGEVIADNLPVVTGRYRPALLEQVQAYRYAMSRAGSGREQADLVAALLARQLVEWDVRRKGAPVAIEMNAVLKLPEPIASQLVSVVLTWAPREQAGAEKNS